MNEDLAKKIEDENIKVHRKEAFFYDSIHPDIFNRYEQKRLMTDINFIAKRIKREKPSGLDIGCGTGNLSLKFLKFGFSVTGLDISKEMLNILKEKYAHYKKKYDGTESNFLKLELCDIDMFISNYKGEKYDVISLSSVLHHLPDYIKTINNLWNLLNRGGIMYIVHEPIKFTSKQHKFWKMLEKGDRLLFRLILLFRNIKIPSIDYTYSDYHKRVDLSKIIDKYVILRYEEYNTCSFGVTSSIDNKWNNSKRKFKIIMEKK